MTRAQLETRVNELLAECDETSQAKNELEDELNKARRSELNALKKMVVLERALRVYINADLGDS